MPTFQYRAKDGIQNVDGVLEANSREEAIEQLNAKGYLPVRVEEKAQPAPESRPKAVRSRSGNIKSKEVTIFSRQLASLIKSGVPILQGLNIIYEQSENSAFRIILSDIHAQVKEGHSLSETMGKYPRVFPPLYIAMVRTGEAGGTLQETLIRIADYRQKQEAIIARVRTAMAYPILMALVGCGTIIFMLTYVMPRLMRIFVRLGQDLPLPTRMLIALNGFIQAWGPWIVVAIAVLIFIARQSARTHAQRLLLSRLKLRMPVVGEFVQKNELARFSRTLELLIKSSVSILQAIRIATPILSNEVIKEELTKCAKELEEGGSFGKSLEKSKLFPGFMTSLITVGEESGHLDEALDEIADTYERDTEEAIKVLTSLLEPLMILVMGLIVGFIVIAMLLPVFEMNMMAK